MKSDEKCVLAIDAGGTYFKSCIIRSDGSIAETAVRKRLVDSSGGSEGILRAYEDIVCASLEFAAENKINLSGIGVSTPGPFDYKGGKSLMKHKFASIYGMDLRAEIILRCGLTKEFRIRFLHDAHAFILGEHWQGAAKGYLNTAGITIGTGLGFGCMINGKIKLNENGGPYVSIYSIPFREGILEDYVSGRGIVNTYRRLTDGMGQEKDAREIGLLAESGEDISAVAAYKEMGRILAGGIEGILNRLRVECLVFGGQISRSFAVMADEIKEGLVNIKTLNKVCMAEDIDLSPLKGAALTVIKDVF